MQENEQLHLATSRGWVKIAVCICALAVSLTFSFVQSVRAPLGYDEAYTYLYFGALPIGEIWRDYHVPNNHILHSVLVHFTTQLFGIAPFAIRLPALIGGALFLYALTRVGRHLLPPTRATWVLLVALTPGIIELNGSARGYSLGCGLSFAALALLMGLVTGRVRGRRGGTRGASIESPDEEQRDALNASLQEPGGTSGDGLQNVDGPIVDGMRDVGGPVVDEVQERPPHAVARLAGAGVLLGLAIGSVPTFAILAVGILLAFFLLARRRTGQTRTLQALAHTAILAVCIALVVAVFYWHVRPDPVKGAGYRSLEWSLRHVGSAVYDMPRLGRPQAWAVAASVILLAAWSLARAWRKGDRAAMLLLAALLFSIATLAVAGAVMSRWPEPRTVIFLYPLVLLGLLYAPLGLLGNRTIATGVSATLIGLALLVAVSSVDLSLHRRSRTAQGIPDALATIDANSTGQRPTVVSITLLHAPSVRYALMRRPRPYLTFVVRNRHGRWDDIGPRDTADFAIVQTSVKRGDWRWEGEILSENQPCGLAVWRSSDYEQ